MDELDEILMNFAHRVGEFPRGKTFGWEAEKADILKHYIPRKEVVEAIGDDEANNEWIGIYKAGKADGRDELRAELKQRLHLEERET